MQIAREIILHKKNCRIVFKKNIDNVDILNTADFSSKIAKFLSHDITYMLILYAIFL